MAIEIVCEKIITDAFSIISTKQPIHRKAKVYKIKSLKALSHDKLPRKYNNRFPKVDMVDGQMDIIPDVNHYHHLSVSDVLLVEDFEVISKTISQARDHLDAIKEELKEAAKHWYGIATFEHTIKPFMIECDKILINGERAYQITTFDGPRADNLPEEYIDSDYQNSEYKERAFIKPNLIVGYDSNKKRFELTRGDKFYVDEFEKYLGVIERACKRLKEIEQKPKWSGEVTFKF